MGLISSYRLLKTENIFRAFLHLKLLQKQPSQHPEKQTRPAACTPTPTTDRLDYNRPKQESSQCRLASWCTRAEPQDCKAPPGFGSGHHPSWSPRHLPSLSHNLVTETEVKVRVVTQVEGWALQNQFLLSTEQGRVKASTGLPAQQPEKGATEVISRQP